MKFEDLLKVIGEDDAREEFTRLGREYVNERRLARAGEGSEERREAALGALMEKVQWHFRAIRHPMPTRQQLEEMLAEHFR